MRMLPGRHLNKILIGICTLLPPLAPSLSAETSTELTLKSAFLCNFTKFVTWPPDTFVDAMQPFTICTLGKNALGGTLESTVTGMRTEDRSFAMRALDSEKEMKGCQVLFVAGSAVAEFDTFLSDVSMPGLLTVTEAEKITTPVPCGVMITFVSDAKRVRFVINQKAAGKAGLTISSKLLNLALSVEKEQPCQHPLEPEQ